MINLILGLVISFIQPAPQGGVVVTREQIDAAVQPLIDDGYAQSIVVGIIDSGGTRVIGYGKISKKEDAPAPDGKTVFEIGSVTKTFTATILAGMQIDGAVKLEDSVQSYLPADVKLKVKDRPITLLDLATHRSGLPRMPSNFAPKNAADPYADYDVDKLYAFLKFWTPTRAPEEEIEYSNLGVGLLGHLLCKQAGASYATLLHDRITGPLGMTDTSITLNDSQKSRLAPAHDADGNVISNWNLGDAVVAAGGIRSTCDDMLKYAAAQMNPPDGKLGEAIKITHEAHAEMTPGREIGLVWMLDAGGTCVWHNGETGGYHSFIAVGPNNGVACVMLGNSSGNLIDMAGSQIIRQQLGMPAGPTVPMRTPVELTAAQLDRFVGEYDMKFAKLSIWRKDDKLMAQLAEQSAFRIYPESDKSCFWKIVDAQLDFDFADEKSPAKSLTLHQNGQNMPGTRTEPTTKPSK